MTGKAIRLSPGEVRVGENSLWNRLPLVAGVVSAVTLSLSFLLSMRDPEQFYFSYLVAFVFCVSLVLGALFFVLIQFVTRSGWSVVVRRTAENVMGTMPIFALLFIPVALGVHHLFHWAHDEALAIDPILRGKQAYLNESFFFIRAAVYFLSWSAVAVWFRSQSIRQDSTGDHDITRRLQAVSAPALILFALTLTFAAFDWLMSLDPHFYSTIFGVYFFAGSTVSSLAFLIVIAAALPRAGITVEHFHDLGKLLFAFTAFWAYIAFSQYFLIWYANIPEETFWYLNRWEGTWQLISIFMGVGHFALPFFFLLPRSVKRSKVGLLAAAIWTLAAHYVDIHWLVMPVLHKEGVALTVLDVTTMSGVLGIFLAAVGWLTRRAAIVPVKDPRLPESLSFENM